jgi:hypothetical protein
MLISEDRCKSLHIVGLAALANSIGVASAACPEGLLHLLNRI